MTLPGGQSGQPSSRAPSPSPSALTSTEVRRDADRTAGVWGSDGRREVADRGPQLVIHRSRRALAAAVPCLPPYPQEIEPLRGTPHPSGEMQIIRKSAGERCTM